jgi:hypothetical protein
VTLQKLVGYVVVDISGMVLDACGLVVRVAELATHLSGFF